MPKKHAGGRPTKYNPKFCQMVEEYLKKCKDKKFLNRVEVKLPKMEGFALFLGVHKDTLYEWAERYPKFSDSLKKILHVQKDKLIDNGLSGDYNSTIAKLILSSDHGMAEKTEQDLTSKGEKIEGITVEFVRGQAKH